MNPASDIPCVAFEGDRCIATGSTPEETRVRMQQAIEMHVQGLKADHLPVPEASAFAEYIGVQS